MLACMACGGIVEAAVVTGGAGLLSIVAIMWDRVRLFAKRRSPGPRGSERLKQFVQEDQLCRLGRVRGSYPMYRIFFGE